MGESAKSPDVILPGHRWRRFVLPGLMLVVSAAVVTVAICIGLQSAPPAPSPPDANADLPNFHRVNERVCRGGRPTATGLRQLKDLGVRTVVDLAGFKDEAAIAKELGLDYVSISAISLDPPREAMVAFLKVISQAERGSFFVHCAAGTYRTGTMIALYRVAIEGWESKRAVAEATDPKFRFSRVNARSLAEFFNTLDVESLRRDAGLGG